MNEETLKYYTALQPLFQEKMGEQQIGDKILFLGSDFLIPLTIDDQNPERGLWEMVKGFGKYLCLNNGSQEYRFSVEKDQYLSETTHYWADTPTLAILKALTEQERIEL